jgi:hypothetical protein
MAANFAETSFYPISGGRSHEEYAVNNRRDYAIAALSVSIRTNAKGVSVFPYEAPRKRPVFKGLFADCVGRGSPSLGGNDS